MSSTSELSFAVGALISGQPKLKAGGLFEIGTSGTVSWDSGAILTMLGGSVATLGGTTTIAALSSATVTGPMTFSGTTAKRTFRPRILIGARIGTVTISPTTGDVFDVPTPTGNMIVIPSLAGVAEGDVSTISKFPFTTGTSSVTIQDGGGGTLEVIPASQNGFIDIMVTNVAGNLLWRTVRFYTLGSTV